MNVSGEIPRACNPFALSQYLSRHKISLVYQLVTSFLNELNFFQWYPRLGQTLGLFAVVSQQ